MTNPSPPPRKTAVALKYNAPRDHAPKLTARGHGHVAAQIIALAQTHGIPMREDPDLVQVLAQLNLQQEIPPQLYQVVAELLAFVYRLNQEYRPPTP